MAENYDGLSMRWARHLVGAGAAWPSARSAADALVLEEVGPLGVSEIPVGSLVFYDQGPWADVGVAVGDRLVLRRKHGVVSVEQMEAKWILGWITGEAFRAAAREAREASQHA